jgi:hypothetical protein
VIAKQDSKERGYKVRNLQRREEYDIRSSELVPWLRFEVQARLHREGMADVRQSRQSVQQDTLLSNEKANDVRILVPQHRSKKTNRRNIVESALLRSREVVENARNGPSPPLIPATTSSTPSAILASQTPTAGEPSIQNAPLTERKYLSQVYELLSDLASDSRASEGPESYTNAFIYNYRTGSCVYYDLGPGDR